MDADHSTPIQAWSDFRKQLDQGARVVIASRHLPDSKIVVPQPLSRRVLGAGYRWLCRRLFGLRVSDFNCGFKAYDSRLAKEIYQEARMKDWTFDVEIFCLLKERHVQVAEVPVSWSHSEKKTRIKPFSTALKTLASLKALSARFKCA
jgi:dolichyl-phosphate beta-glucosyltransferase